MKPASSKETLSAYHDERGLGEARDRRLLVRLWAYVRPYRSLLYAGLALIVFTAGLGLLRPLLMQHAIDDGVLAGQPEKLLQAGLLLAGVLVLEQVLLFVQIYAVQIVGAKAMADLRAQVFRFLHGLRLGYFDTQPIGRLLTRVTNDVDAILEFFASGALNALGDLVRLFGIVVLMLWLDAKLALIAFAATPLVALLVFSVRRRMREAFREIRLKTARINATLGEQVSGIGVVQAFRREARVAEEFDEVNRGYRDANLRTIKFEAIQDAAIEMVAAVCLSSIIVALGYHPVSFGKIVAFNAYLFMFFEPISALGQRYVLLQSALSGAERVLGLLETDAKDAPFREPAQGGDPELAFAFEAVDFAYKPGVPVLFSVSLQAKRGEHLALVGPTGSGKSTMASLLLRLYEPSSGVIRVHGQDIAGLSREALRAQFAMVPQDVYLFPTTIAGNIAASLEPDLERVARVVHRLGVWDVLGTRPGGLLAPVEEQGRNFSAGERQLIAFARALYRDSPIVVLDEATANVDPETEGRLQLALTELLRGRTSLIIAHRLSTIRAADRIAVFQAGRVVEEGTHDELLRRDGLYHRLYELQFSRQPAPAA